MARRHTDVDELLDAHAPETADRLEIVAVIRRRLGVQTLTCQAHLANDDACCCCYCDAYNMATELLKALGVVRRYEAGLCNAFGVSKVPNVPDESFAE